MTSWVTTWNPSTSRVEHQAEQTKLVSKMPQEQEVLLAGYPPPGIAPLTGTELNSTPQEIRCMLAVNKVAVLIQQSSAVVQWVAELTYLSWPWIILCLSALEKSYINPIVYWLDGPRVNPAARKIYLLRIRLAYHMLKLKLNLVEAHSLSS